jgi:hypothetical protein
MKESPHPDAPLDASQQVRELSRPENFINWQLSQLEFNWRVLAQALDTRTPVLERLKFLCIFSTNMDEFYEIRVAGLKHQAASLSAELGPENLTPQEILEAISGRAHELVAEQYRILNEVIFPELAQEGINFIFRSSPSRSTGASLIMGDLPFTILITEGGQNEPASLGFPVLLVTTLGARTEKLALFQGSSRKGCLYNSLRDYCCIISPEEAKQQLILAFVRFVVANHAHQVAQGVPVGGIYTQFRLHTGAEKTFLQVQGLVAQKVEKGDGGLVLEQGRIRRRGAHEVAVLRDDGAALPALLGRGQVSAQYRCRTGPWQIRG